MWREHSRSLSAPVLRTSRCLLHTTRVSSAPLAASMHLPGTIQSSPPFSIAAALAHSLFGGTSPAFSRHVLAASSSWFSSTAAASNLESDVVNASANHIMTRPADTTAGAADIDLIALSPAVGLLLHSYSDSVATENVSALQNRVAGILSELAAHGNVALSNAPTADVQTATARMNQIMSQLAVRGTVRELECVVEALASTVSSSSGLSADASALASTWFNTALQLFCAAVRRSSHAPLSSSSAAAHIPHGRVPLAAAQVGTLLRMLARIDAIRTASLASASQPLQSRRHITVTATAYEPLLVALAPAGQVEACWTTTQRLLSARESLTPPALTAVMAALYRHGEMTAADTLARVVRSSALPFDASHRALCARAHLRWAKGSALVPHHVPTAVEQTSYSVAASAARKALEFTLSSSQQGSAESSSGSSDSLSMTNIPADPAGRALLIECVAIDESDAAAEALIYRIEHQALRDQQRTVAGGSNSAELSHSYALNAVALSAWTVLVERACRRGDLGNAARLIGLVNERMNEWVRRLRATSIEASDAAIAAVLEADEPDELESSTDGIAPSDHLWSYWRAHRAFLAALCSNPLHVDSAIAHLGALESVAAVDVSQSSSQFSSESSNAKLASSSAVGMLKSLPTSLSRLLRNATSDGVDEPISAEEAADIIRHDIAQRIAGLKVSAPQHIPLHAAVAIPVLRTWIEANQSKRALSWVLANSNSTVKSNMNPRGTSLASHDLKLPHCAAIFHLFYDRAVRSGCQSDHGDSKPSHALSSTVDILSAMRERGIAPTPAFFTSDIQAALSNGQSAQTATTDSEHAAVANATRILDALPAVGVRAEAAAFDAILTRLIDHHSNVAVRTILESTGTASLPNTKARAKSSPNSNTSSNTTLRMEPDQAAFDAMLAAVTRTLQTAVARRACFDARLFATAAQRLLAHADRLFDTMRKGNPSMSSSSSTSASVSTVQQVANSAAAAELSRVDAALDRLMTALEDARLTPTPVRRSSAPVYASVISHLLRRRRQLPAAERVLHRVMAQHRRAQASPLSQASGKPGSSAGGVAAAAAAYVPVQPTLGLLEPFLGVYVSDRGRIMTGQRQALLDLLEFCVQHQLHRAVATSIPPTASSSNDSASADSVGRRADVDTSALIMANMRAASADLKAASAAERATEATAARVRALIKTHAPSLFGAVLLDLFRHVQVAPLPHSSSPSASSSSPSSAKAL